MPTAEARPIRSTAIPAPCAPPARPARTHTRLHHIPALDGIRGLAVAAVLLFHGGFLWAKGGYLGVTVFFVLSGFLITSLLLAERERTGGISLRAFWGRRARRLAPALLVLVALVAAYQHFGVRHPEPGVGGDALAAIGWVANWRFLLAHSGYAGLFAAPSPFQHTWSLAIEEQFYVLVALLAVLVLARRTDARGRAILAAFGGLAIIYALLVPFGALGFKLDNTALYYRTDIRMAEPLIGVLLALALLHKGRIVQLPSWARRSVDVAGVAGVFVLTALVARLGQYSPAVFKGGLLAAALASAAVVAAATQEGTLINRALAFPPAVALGKISYGLYLFHWPLDLWITHRRVPVSPWGLFEVRTAVALAVAVVSYFVIEQPIRHGKIRSPRVALIGWADAAVAAIALVLLATMVVPPHASRVLAASGSSPLSSPSTTVPSRSRQAAPTATTRPAVALSRPIAAKKAAPSGGAGLGASDGPKTAAPPPPTAQPGEVVRLKIAVIGDSMANVLADGLNSWAQDAGGVLVYNLSVIGCPISRGGTRQMPDGETWPIGEECGWWNRPASDRSKKLAEFAPDVIVMQDGMNEVPDRIIDGWSSYRHAGDPGYDHWLLAEYRAAITHFGSSGAKILFLNTVCADWDLLGERDAWNGYQTNNEGDRRVSALNRDDTAATLTGARLADFDAQICPNGKFTQDIDGVPNGRPDGYHLSEEASAALARDWLGPLVFETSGKQS